MVRINQKTEFTFPFGNVEEPIISTNNLGKSDRLLSSFTLPLFIGVLFLILSDGNNFSLQNNVITPSLSSQGMMSLLLLAMDNTKDELIHQSTNPLLKTYYQ